MKKDTDQYKIRLTRAEEQALLKFARRVLETYLFSQKKPTPQELGLEITDSMRQRAGAFVTLTQEGELRGCIGEIFAQRSVVEVIADRVVDAAVHDPRFHPVSAKELKDISIEISILTPPQEVSSYNDIMIGRHGILLKKRGRSSVFLPQVAPEQGWDLETTLRHLSLKAGLGSEDWRQDTQFEVFEALVFHEEK